MIYLGRGSKVRGNGGVSKMRRDSNKMGKKRKNGDRMSKNGDRMSVKRYKRSKNTQNS